ncbi:hypothetical protein DPMN_189019 [Dreissena polymorpha]|uniref:Uncharacterized protein n=1 Tax=Dreissena polymorpha TaxID=45954 RepID=A0A9D4DR74_DREPO|nr:hypothetical protein DPMN_189019 [Dreissena polymorpha]
MTSSSSLSCGGQVYEAIWALAAASAMGDRFMKHPALLNLTATVDQHDLQQQPQPWGTGL